uniref:Dynein axonemal intermediate chain 4 n=1 Tax=Knipowitschia caucasica TaxID=637954 RepID=A0AAV2JNR8_KNICA
MNSDRAAQTLISPFKNKLIQSDNISTRDTGTYVSTWEMFDSLRVPEEAEASEGLQPAVTQSDLQGAERLLSSRAEHSTSVESSSGTVSESSSMKDLEALELSVRESELTLLLSSPSFHYSLRVMERSLAGNSFQQRLATFRHLPVLTGTSAARAHRYLCCPRSQVPLLPAPRYLCCTGTSAARAHRYLCCPRSQVPLLPALTGTSAARAHRYLCCPRSQVPLLPALTGTLLPSRCCRAHRYLCCPRSQVPLLPVLTGTSAARAHRYLCCPCSQVPLLPALTGTSAACAHRYLCCPRSQVPLLPALTDPFSALPSEQEGSQEPPESEGSAPALVHLWSFSCDLTQGRRVNCMVWNKKNPDVLAVGYGSSVSSPTPGLVCCWSLRNPTWPDSVIPCDRAVTALDFSLKSPGQLGVGLEDGTVMICGVHRSSSSSSSVLNSRCSKHKHTEPVLQLRWILQDVSLRDDQQEALVSVATDGRVCKWFVSNSGLDCTDMMKLKRVKSPKRIAGDNREETKLESILSALTPGTCFDFHPNPKESGVYLVGTWEGLIHKCSSSNSQQFTDTYKKHSGPVLGVSWSPLSPGLFLSCSSDWSLKLWREERSGPVLVLSSPYRAVLDSCWSPQSATVIGAVSEAQLEIWDLQHSILDPLLVLPAPPSVSFTSLVFSPHSDCAVVGDSGGQVWVHLLHSVHSGGPGTQALDDIILASVSK